MISLNCEECGDEVVKKPSEVKRKDHHFCSQECWIEWQRDNIEVECDMCGIKFERVRSATEDRDNIFCSKGCHDEFQDQKISVECEWCGDIVKKIPYSYNNSNHHFCSNECAGKWRTGENHPNWKNGGKDRLYYGENWHRTRRKALERDDCECRICGRGEDELGMSPDVHHIIRIREFEEPEDANYLENLVCLCPKHHNLIEKNNFSCDVQAALFDQEPFINAEK